jgi:hypothetical protein
VELFGLIAWIFSQEKSFMPFDTNKVCMHS